MLVFYVIFYADCSDGDDEDCGEVFLVYFICLR